MRCSNAHYKFTISNVQYSKNIYILKNISIKAHHNNINKMPYRKITFYEMNMRKTNLPPAEEMDEAVDQGCLRSRSIPLFIHPTTIAFIGDLTNEGNAWTQLNPG